MKKVIISLALSALATLSVRAQAPTFAAVSPAQTNGSAVVNIALAAATATNFYAVIDVRKQKNVELQIVTTNTLPDAVLKNTLYYQRSVDGTSYENTLSPIAWTTTTALGADPANPLVILTNIDTWGCGWIRFPYLTNASAASTNIASFTLKYGIKVSAP